MTTATFKWDYFHEIVKFLWVISILKNIIISLLIDENRVCDIESVTGKSHLLCPLCKTFILFWLRRRHTAPATPFCVFLHRSPHLVVFWGSEGVGSILIKSGNCPIRAGMSDWHPHLCDCSQTPKSWSLGWESQARQLLLESKGL